MHRSIVTLIFSCKIKEFCVTSLALDNWGQQYCQTLGNESNPPIPQTDRQTDLPSNFLKIARLLRKIKHTVSLRFISLCFGAKIVPCEDMSLLPMNSLYREKGNDPYLWSWGKNFTLCAARTIIFHREKFKLFNILFHSVYLVFSIRLISIADLFAVRYLWDIFNEDKCCVVTHLAADILVASLGLFTWVVYVRKCCAPIATLNQKKRSWLLCLSDAQIINITMWKYCWKGFIWIVNND